MKEMNDWYLRNFRVTKPIKITAVICAASLCLCACDNLDEAAEELAAALAGETESALSDSRDDNSDESDIISFENEIMVYDEVGDLVESQVSVIDEAEQEDNYTQLSAGNLATVALNAFDGGSSSYAYNKLSPSAQKTYKEIHSILTEVLDDVILTGKDTDEIDLAFRAVMVDHPEIFYVNGYSLGKYMIDGKLNKISFGGTYTMSKEEVEQKRKLVDEYVEKVIMKAPVSGDYEKIKYVYDYLVNNNTYDLSAENNQNILSVVEGGRTVCQGYAKMMQLMLARLDIFCTLVNGSAKSGEDTEYNAHVWNIVKCNGEYYNIDATWGDSIFKLINTDGGASPQVDINYEFFMVPDSELKDSHRPEPVVEMPECFSLDDNYYVREGLYFEVVDEEQLSEAFERGYAKGESILFLKAMDSEVFGELFDYLITDHNVFQYTGTDNVRYVDAEARNLIMISL